MIKPEYDGEAEHPSRLASRRRTRWAALILAVLFFLWLPFEDTGSHWVVLFAVAAAAWGAVRYTGSARGRSTFNLKAYLIVGLLAGLAVTPIAIFLMIFKNGIHGHPVADFTFDQMITIAGQFYIWVIAGLLVGAGLYLVKKSRNFEQQI